MPEDASSETALGWVPFVEGRARQLVYLRVSRARTMIYAVSPGKRPGGMTDLLVAKLLGRSLAHELGHVLLNSRDHDTTGLMRARLSCAGRAARPALRVRARRATARSTLREPRQRYSPRATLASYNSGRGPAW